MQIALMYFRLGTVKFLKHLLLTLAAVALGASPAIAEASCDLPAELRTMPYSDAVTLLEAECSSCAKACTALDVIKKWKVCQLEDRKCPEVDGDMRNYERADRKLVLGQMLRIRRAAEKNRTVAEKKKLDDIDAATTPPLLNRKTINQALHAVYSGSSKLSNGTVAGILRIDANTFSSCDEEYCYAMMGVVKSKMSLDSNPECSMKFTRKASCEFDFRLSVESTLSDSNDIRNQLLNSLTRLELIAGRGNLRFKRGQWQFVTFEIDR